MELTLTNNRIAVKRIKNEEEKRGSIYLPPSAQNQPSYLCEVINAGPGNLNDRGVFIPSPVKVGDRVITSEFHGCRVKIDDEEIWICRIEDIYAIVDHDVKRIVNE